MNLNDKCLLVLKPAQPFQHWLQDTLNEAEKIIQNEDPAHPRADLEVDLENLQADASCYLMPVLPPEQTASFIRNHFEKLFSRELNAWCNYKEAWPLMDFSNFAAGFNFEFYFDWMNFKQEQLSENTENLESIILLVKPKEKFTEFLRTVIMKKFSMAENEIDQKLDLSVIQRGSTAVITDITDIDDVEYFLNQHAEEIFRHQLILWGGEESEDLWPRDTDWRAFGESFEVEIHRHNYLMLH